MSGFLEQIESAVHYVESRQNADGGFCFYRYEDWGMSESNVPDTFYAVATLSIVGHSIPKKESVVQFLRSCEPADGCFPSITIGWSFLNAMRLLKAPLAVAPNIWLEELMHGLEVSLLNSSKMEWSGALRDMCRLLELCQVYGVVCPVRMQTGLRRAVLMLKGASGGYGWPGANLLDTGSVVRIYSLLHWGLQRSALEYARSCEDENLGFTLAPNASNATLAVLLAGIDTVHFFNERPRYETVLLRYLLTCQTGKGGFAPVPGALADLENTYIAFECLRALGRLQPIGSA
ncbi:MAG: prenyltransferase/squalene oxidase repeat-containing protein [Deltaproteobacteria bacterium]|jgi:hypothetical protein|nr:prenyltransferase/squalene oxidase repeat-containing protein [Deltaproteobacteria bacterium]